MSTNLRNTMLLGLGIFFVVSWTIPSTSQNCSEVGPLKQSPLCPKWVSGTGCVSKGSKCEAAGGFCYEHPARECDCDTGATLGFTDVTAPGASETDTYGINNSGVIAGDYNDSYGAQHGMLLEGKKLVTADRSDCSTSPGVGVTFVGLNNKDKAAGWCQNRSGAYIGFTYSKGKFANIRISGATLVEANGVNDKDEVVGTYVDSSGAQHGFLLAGSKLTTLDVPGGGGTVAWGINNHGLITASGGSGSAYTKDEGKHWTSFSDPKAIWTIIHTPNNAGEIVGTYFDSSGGVHMTFFTGDKYYEYDDNGLHTRGDGINDKVEIVGRYGVNVGFIAKPKK
ncbi:MAG TPA: hypothetical protein VNZ03_32625 [Terriglobales bacterium]|jgi:hypothetical protein|nr:hypothetical protein [Terriglobales bacterium]